MVNTKRKIALLAALLMISTVATHFASAAGYVSINDIKEEVRDGWHETYYYNGEEIRVDVDIELPDVDAVKIIRVVMPTDMQANYAPENAVVNPDYFEGGGILYYLITTPHILPANAIETKKGSGTDDFGEPGTQAEYNSLTPEDAQALFLSKLEPYREQLDIDGFKLDFFYASSRTYERVSRDERNGTQVLNYQKPLTTMGYYTLYYHQVFYGVPMFHAYPSYEHSIKNERLDASIQGRVYGWIAAENDYALGFSPMLEDCVLVEDAPLISFSEVKKEFERLIMEGYIRRVVQVRLGYIIMNDPSDLGNQFVLIPVWELNGSIVTSPEKASPKMTYPDKFMQDIWNRQFIQVNAQTGIYYDINDKSPTRRDTNFITWDEVK